MLKNYVLSAIMQMTASALETFTCKIDLLIRLCLYCSGSQNLQDFSVTNMTLAINKWQQDDCCARDFHREKAKTEIHVDEAMVIEDLI